MRVVHDPGGGATVLASDVETADSVLARTAGLMGRASLPEDYALVFRFSRTGRRVVHMLFVRVPLDVLWLRGGEVVRAETLRPWTGIALAKADTVVELPAGAADGVAVGDEVVAEGGAAPG